LASYTALARLFSICCRDCNVVWEINDSSMRKCLKRSNLCYYSVKLRYNLMLTLMIQNLKNVNTYNYLFWGPRV
jgi:hypothetical protein